jgi:hypothetical protein
MDADIVDLESVPSAKAAAQLPLVSVTLCALCGEASYEARIARTPRIRPPSVPSVEFVVKSVFAVNSLESWSP